MNNPNPNITEADVLAFFQAKSAEFAPQFPHLHGFSATHFGGSLSDPGRVGFFAYVDERYNAVTASGPTFEQAVAKLREKLGTPTRLAAKKREEAARLIAEANALDPNPPAQ